MSSTLVPKIWVYYPASTPQFTGYIPFALLQASHDLNSFQ